MMHSQRKTLPVGLIQTFWLVVAGLLCIFVLFCYSFINRLHHSLIISDSSRGDLSRSSYPLASWDKLHAAGYTRIAPIGGSDDHHGGQNEKISDSKLGQPTTMVFAQVLCESSLVSFDAIMIMMHFSASTLQPHF